MLLAVPAIALSLTIMAMRNSTYSPEPRYSAQAGVTQYSDWIHSDFG